MIVVLMIVHGDTGLPRVCSKLKVLYPSPWKDLVDRAPFLRCNPWGWYFVRFIKHGTAF